MDVAHDQFQRLLQEARDDPAILGLVLTGSRGKGFGSAGSDYDLIVIVWPGKSCATNAMALPTSRCCSTRPGNCQA